MRMGAMVLGALSAPMFLFSVGLVIAGEVTSSGTGFLINSDGWVITNAHVVQDCSKLIIGSFGEAVDRQVDVHNDIAALKLTTTPATRHPLRLRKDAPRLGEDIAAMGYPLSDLLSDGVKITTGNINSLVGMENDTRYLQISAPVQPGNSGGPLVDRAGDVLGINTAVLGLGFAAKTGTLPQNVNFAVKSSVLELFLQSRSIAYQTADTTGSPMPTADVADKVSPAVYQILCYGESRQDAAEVIPENPPAPSGQQNGQSPGVMAATPRPIPYHSARHFVDHSGYDALGFDYATLKSVSFAECKTACKNDKSCSAITYNIPVKFCFLKNDVAILVKNNDAIASIEVKKSEKVMITSFMIRSNHDISGHDYRRLRGSSFISCFVACTKDNLCRAFSYLRKNNDCWLKNSTGLISKKNGVDLGVK